MQGCYILGHLGPPWSEHTGWEPGAGSEATAAPGQTHLSAGEIVVPLCMPETADVSLKF